MTVDFPCSSYSMDIYQQSAKSVGHHLCFTNTKQPFIFHIVSEVHIGEDYLLGPIACEKQRLVRFGDLHDQIFLVITQYWPGKKIS